MALLSYVMAFGSVRLFFSRGLNLDSYLPINAMVVRAANLPLWFINML